MAHEGNKKGCNELVGALSRSMSRSALVWLSRAANSPGDARHTVIMKHPRDRGQAISAPVLVGARAKQRSVMQCSL
jgi:hypothetical protein